MVENYVRFGRCLASPLSSLATWLGSVVRKRSLIRGQQKTEKQKDWGQRKFFDHFLGFQFLTVIKFPVREQKFNRFFFSCLTDLTDLT